MLADDSGDDGARPVCVKCREPIIGPSSWFGLTHKECPVGFPLVKSPPLRHNYDCACETKVVASFEAYSFEWGRCVKCGGWGKCD